MEHTGTVEQMPTNVARQITQQPTSALVPYARNSRTHSAEQVAQIAASIREFGFTNPVLVDAAGGIVAGHGRVMAAQHLGMAEVPTICVGWLSESQRRAYVIADNQLALNAGWDADVLSAELLDLQAIGFDLDLLGFDDDALAGLLGNADSGDGAGADGGARGSGSLSARFMIPPFSVLNAREGWWQDRKRAWLALGIKSELGRGGGADYASRACDIAGAELLPGRSAPGGSARPACDYSKKQRGNGAGRAING